VGLAQAIVHDPKVLILDEPTDGLDPLQKHEVRTLIGEIAREKTIVISTHILEEVDAVCTRAIIVARGKLVADGTPEALKARAPSGRLERVPRRRRLTNSGVSENRPNHPAARLAATSQRRSPTWSSSSPAAGEPVAFFGALERGQATSPRSSPSCRGSIYS
jgi:ABC-2 type transport system ATP-binding protein